MFAQVSPHSTVAGLVIASVTFLAPIAGLTTHAHSQAPQIVRDINAVTSSGSSYPSLFTTVGGTTYFVADAGLGRELYQTLGIANSTRLVADVRAGAVTT